MVLWPRLCTSGRFCDALRRAAFLLGCSVVGARPPAPIRMVLGPAQQHVTTTGSINQLFVRVTLSVGCLGNVSHLHTPVLGMSHQRGALGVGTSLSQWEPAAGSGGRE